MEYILKYKFWTNQIVVKKYVRDMNLRIFATYFVQYFINRTTKFRMKLPFNLNCSKEKVCFQKQ